MTQHQPSGRRRWYVEKTPAKVELALADGTQLTGAFYLASGERVSDVLNDGRSFLPFLRDDGQTLMVAKSAITLCKPDESAG